MLPPLVTWGSQPKSCSKYVHVLKQLFCVGSVQVPPGYQPGLPAGLEYLTHLDQVIVKQQIELLEGNITVTSQGCHGVSNRRHLDHLFNSLFKLTKDLSKLREGNPSVTGGFPTQRPAIRKAFSFRDIIMDAYFMRKVVTDNIVIH